MSIALPDYSRSFSKGCKYIEEKYSTDEKPYGWKDFLGNSSGYSTTWVTSAILYFSHGLLPEHIVRNFRKQFRLFIQPDAGVGYSTSAPSDCDSTLFFVKACLALQILPLSVIEQIRFILDHQCANGGFRTYRDEELLRSWKHDKYSRFRGWTSDHICVSSAALDLFSSHGYFQNNFPEQIAKLIVYLSNKQNDDGSWDSYWWYTKYYSTAYTLNALLKLNRQDSGIYRKGRAFVAESFRDGFWTNGLTETPSVFSTALSLNFLMNESYLENKAIIDEGISFLYEHASQTDGSWTSEPILKIPGPDILPDDEQEFQMHGRGVGSCSNDPFNLYTTSYITMVLDKYEQL